MTINRTAPWDRPQKYKSIIAAENAHGDRVQLPSKVLADVRFVASLIAAETLLHSQEAAEQLDILSAIQQGYIHPVTPRVPTTHLTKSQKATLESLAKRDGEIRLYRETSMSGLSETLRYTRRWVEMGRWGASPRSESHMILSVTIRPLPDGSDDPEYLAKYKTLCEEAEQYFKELRQS
jgi:hypothetical protein